MNENNSDGETATFLKRIAAIYGLSMAVAMTLVGCAFAFLVLAGLAGIGLVLVLILKFIPVAA